MRNFHEELGYKQKAVRPISCNNDGAVVIPKNPMFHKRTKHIDSKYHWVQEKVEEGRFYPESCCTAEQTAYMVTKALPRPKHEQHTAEMGIAPV